MLWMPEIGVFLFGLRPSNLLHFKIVIILSISTKFSEIQNVPEQQQ